MKFTTRKFSLFLILLLSLTLLSYQRTSSFENSNFSVHFIDIGQGDSILIQVNNKNLLIDSGTKDSVNQVVKYLKKLKVKTLDYIIATHPHEDHIGGMNVIIDNFNINSFHSPKVTHTSESFKNMIYSLNNKKLHINIINSEKPNSIDLGENTHVEILAPSNKEYENINNYSPIIKISYGKTSFLFTGDAEEELENEVIKKNLDLKADVLKIGHHGSKTSTSDSFLNKISPNIAVMSVGLDNSYGHPSNKIIEKLENNKIKILRTDEDGTIVLSSNGNDIKTQKILF